MDRLTSISKKLNEQNNKYLNDLYDVDKTGKERGWRMKKELNSKMRSTYEFLSHMTPSDFAKVPRIKKFFKGQKHYQSRARRLKDCAVFLDFFIRKSGRKKLKTANFCRVRLCPMCTWRRSLKLQSQLEEVLSTPQAQQYSYIFLTLTIPNISDIELAETIKKLHVAFNRLTKYKEVSKIVKGYFRSTELTYNRDRRDWHPHIHVLIAVNQSYFKSRDYISQLKWLALWKKAMKDESIKQVDVRRVKQRKGESLMKTVCEVAKYPVKDSQYIDFGDDIFTAEQVVILDNVLERKRFVGWGGVLQDIRHEFEQEDIEADSVDLVNESEDIDLDVDPIDETKGIERYFWLESWNGYKLTGER